MYKYPAALISSSFLCHAIHSRNSHLSRIPRSQFDQKIRMSSQPIRVGIIGYGLSAIVFHIPFIDASSQFKLQAVLQRSPPKSASDKHISNARPEVRWVQNEDDFFALADVDLVVLSTPPALHCAQALKALEAGKHVIVEKPFTPTSAEADTLVAAAKKSGKVLTVFQNRRFDSDFLTLQRLIQTTPSPMGEVLNFESTMDRWSPQPSAKSWKSSDPAAGSIFDLGAHIIDQALVLFGVPETVQAVLANQRTPEDQHSDDAFTIILGYEGLRKTVILRSSMLSCLAVQPRYQVRGTKGSFVKGGIDPQEDQRVKVSPPLAIEAAEFGVEDSSIYGVLTTDAPIDGSKESVTKGMWETSVKSEKGNYLGFYENLGKAIQGTGELLVKPEEARNVIKLIEVAKRSSKEGKRLAWE
ncbi:oxidoreductase family protein [Phlyctema vagabunda]|uniref:Oxidoreductase family protein n=1 Tax=Phlyctema vagabunda TaxID=108571 RepID=A0ABR4PYC6_9HELO